VAANEGLLKGGANANDRWGNGAIEVGSDIACGSAAVTFVRKRGHWLGLTRFNSANMPNDRLIVTIVGLVSEMSVEGFAITRHEQIKRYRSIRGHRSFADIMRLLLGVVLRPGARSEKQQAENDKEFAELDGRHS
jgi:hypothetical protein